MDYLTVEGNVGRELAISSVDCESLYCLTILCCTVSYRASTTNLSIQCSKAIFLRGRDGQVCNCLVINEKTVIFFLKTSESWDSLIWLFGSLTHLPVSRQFRPFFWLICPFVIIQFSLLLKAPRARSRHFGLPPLRISLPADTTQSELAQPHTHSNASFQVRASIWGAEKGIFLPKSCCIWKQFMTSLQMSVHWSSLARDSVGVSRSRRQLKATKTLDTSTDWPKVSAKENIND